MRNMCRLHELVAALAVVHVALAMAHGTAMSLPLRPTEELYSPSSDSLGTAIGRYFAGKTDLLEVRVQLEHPELELRNVMDDVVDVLRQSQTSLACRLHVQADVASEADHHYYHLWYVDTYAAFRQLLPDMAANFGNDAGHFAIVLVPSIAGAHIVDVARMLAALFRLNVADVAVVLCDPSAVAACTVYSYLPFRANRCRDVTPLAVNFFIDGAFSQPELFPQKFANLHRCRLRFLARNADPFFSYAPLPDNVPDGADVYPAHSLTVGGIEGELLKLVARELNFSVEYDVDPLHQWGDVSPNGSTGGPFDLLEGKRVDAVIGYFTYTPQRVRYFAESFSHVSSPVVVVLGRKLRTRSAIRLTWALDPFALSTWVHILWQFFVSVALFNFAKSRYCRQLQENNAFLKRCTWLDIIGTLLGTPRLIYRPNDGLCYAILVVRVGVMIITAAYRGQLYVAYHHVGAPRPHTLADVVARNYTFLLRHTVTPPAAFEALQVPPARIARIYSQEAYPVYDAMRRHPGRVATLASRERFLYYMRRNRLQSSFEIVPQTVFMQHMCLYFQRHSFLRTPFNGVISKVRSGGLVNKWRTDQYLLLRRSQQRSLAYRRNCPRALPLSIFIPIFWGLLVCEGLALCAFGAELLIHRYRRRLNLRLD